MPRPKTKIELKVQSHGNYERLMAFVRSFWRQQQLAEFPNGMLNRNVRDVLAHLHHWHLVLLTWYEVGMRGEKPAMPFEGYIWMTLPDLNLLMQPK